MPVATFARFSIALLTLSLFAPIPTLARGGGGHSSRYCSTCARDSRGRIQRSSSERMKFLRSHGLTHTPPGMQVDHIVPLAKGGADTTANMQLIPKDSAKERDELK